MSAPWEENKDFTDERPSKLLKIDHTKEHKKRLIVILENASLETVKV